MMVWLGEGYCFSRAVLAPDESEGPAEVDLLEVVGVVAAEARDSQ